MTNREKVIFKILDWLILIGVMVLLFVAAGCKSSQIITEETKTKQKDSISIVLTDEKNTKTEIEKTIYKGIEDSFNVPLDSNGNLPEFHKDINTGNVKGQIGYSKEKGSYYSFSTKEIETVNKKKILDAIKEIKEHNSKIANRTIKSTKETKTTKWGTFNWITFIIALLVVLFIIYRVYNYLQPMSWIAKIKNFIK